MFSTTFHLTIPRHLHQPNQTFCGKRINGNSSHGRREHKNGNLIIRIPKDDITDFEDLLDWLPSINLPTNYTYITTSECAVLSHFSSESFNNKLSPHFQSFIRIFHDLSFDFYIDGIRIHGNRFYYLLETNDTI